MKHLLSLATPLLLVCSLYSMENYISEQLHYTQHALDRMRERQVTAEEVVHVLRTGKRLWDTEHRDAEKFVERKNKTNPLIVVLNRNVDPHSVITIYKDISTPKNISRKLTSREEHYLAHEKIKKAKDLQRERNTSKEN